MPHKMIPQDNANQPPKPWDESDHLPWDDPGFSERMLNEHLSQEHDLASRRSETIDRQVQWIHNTLLSGKPSRVLDLGCGPGLYLQRLAALGHNCVGIDYSPASIAYAKDAAKQAGHDIRYLHQDVRKAEFGTGFDLAIMIWGEINVFPPQDAKALLRKCNDALNDDGLLLLEPHNFDAVQKRGEEPSSQTESDSGLFLGSPHTCLQENAWDSTRRAATCRWTVTEKATNEKLVYAASYQAYTPEEYEILLTETGFDEIRGYPSLTGETKDRSEYVTVLTAKKAESG